MTVVVSRTTSLTEAKPPKASIQKLPYFLINAFIIIFTLSDRNRTLLLNQYLYNRLARDVLGNVTIDTTSQPCVNESDSTSSDTDADRVQSMTSSMIMKFDITGSVLSVFAVLFLGTFSTSLGRRAQLLIPISGYTVRALSILAVAFWDLNISWLYIGCVAEGIMGGIAGIYLGAYLYVSDITPRNRKRTLGMALLEGIRGIMGSGINIASGQMIQRTTFLVPALFTACCALTCFIMACLMPNRMQTSEKWSLELVKRSYRTLVSPISKTKDHRVRRMVLVAAVVYFFGFSTIFGLDRVRLLYLMHRPFCMSAIAIGWYQFGRQALFNTTIITLVPLLHRWLPGLSLAIVGALASTAEYTMYAFALNDVHLYIALGLAFGQGLPLNLIRGETSRLFGTAEQGDLGTCKPSVFQYLWKDYNSTLAQTERESQGEVNHGASLPASGSDDLEPVTASSGDQKSSQDISVGEDGGGETSQTAENALEMTEFNTERGSKDAPEKLRKASENGEVKSDKPVSKQTMDESLKESSSDNGAILTRFVN